MPNMSPIFPMSTEPHHFGDYGFDPQVDYFQASFHYSLFLPKWARKVLEEARRQTKRNETRSIDTIHFKLSKPISKDHDRSKSKKRKWWWKSALGFLKRNHKSGSGDHNRHNVDELDPVTVSPGCFYPYRAVTGPVYVTEPVSGSGTPCRTTSRSASGPLPYVCLRDLNVTDGHRISASMPIYLVS